MNVMMWILLRFNLEENKMVNLFLLLLYAEKNWFYFAASGRFTESVPSTGDVLFRSYCTLLQSLIEHCSQLLCKIIHNSGTLRKEDYEAYHKELSETVGVQKGLKAVTKDQRMCLGKGLVRYFIWFCVEKCQYSPH